MPSSACQHPHIATMWTGPKKLHYINHICLASFVTQGHSVRLYTLPKDVAVTDVPDGVEVVSVEEVYPGLAGRLSRFRPAQAADLFRVILLRETDCIWADTDAFCLRPFNTKDGYLFASEREDLIDEPSDGNLNNGVLALPKMSEGLAMLCEYALHTLKLREAENEHVLSYIRNPVGQPYLRHGPKALTHFLSLSGELEHQSPNSRLYPIHFNLSDCLWDPLVDVYSRFDAECLSVHIWFSQVRPGWLRRRALKGSFMWKEARKHSVNMNKLKY